MLFQLLAILKCLPYEMQTLFLQSMTLKNNYKKCFAGIFLSEWRTLNESVERTELLKHGQIMIKVAKSRYNESESAIFISNNGQI